MTTIPVVLRRRPPQRFASGGLAKAAARVRDAGRADDTMLVHVTPTEFEMLKEMSGEPSVHPQTGMPEFSLWKSIKKLAKFAGPVLAIAAPSVGEGIGNFLGITDPQWAGAAGNAIIGGGLGALGGSKGIVPGALMGGLAGYFSPQVRDFIGLDPSGGTLIPGQTPGWSQSAPGWDVAGASGVPGQAISEATGSALKLPIAAAATAGEGGTGGILGKALPLLLAAGALGAGRTSQKAPIPEQTQSSTSGPLPDVTFDRRRNDQTGIDFYTYGSRPEFSFFTDNSLPKEDEDEEDTKTAASGGRIGGLGSMSTSPRPGGYVGIRTPSSGRADDIDAKLSNNEYVFTAEDTALLGDGNPDHGARKLDEMRANLRRHKGQALGRGKISPNAKRPETYMRGGLSAMRRVA